MNNSIHLVQLFTIHDDACVRVSNIRMPLCQNERTLRKDNNCNALVLSKYEQRTKSDPHYYVIASGLENKQGSSHDRAPLGPPMGAHF
jgi:hypothetical protein